MVAGTNGIVVGVDESAGAAAALRWAAREGDARGWPVTAVLAWGSLDTHGGIVGERVDPSYGEPDALAALDEIVATVLLDKGDAIRRRAVSGLAASALLEASEGADLLVVGARGLGGFRRLLLGSVSTEVLHHAECAVAIVREVHHPREQPEHVVVGVDGSATSRRALAWALDTARLHGATVEIVTAWTLAEPITRRMTGAGMSDAPLEDVARWTIDTALDASDTSGLPQPVTRTVAFGSPAAAVLDAGQRADLIVLGSRGIGGFAALLLGSVSHHVAQHATCPVVILPPEPEPSANASSSVER